MCVSKFTAENTPAKTKFGRPIRAKHFFTSSSPPPQKTNGSKTDISMRTSSRSTAGRSRSLAAVRTGASRHFPLQLHNMLDQAEEKGFEDIVSWQPHGRCFVVHRPKEFVEEIMPLYFKQSKFASFQRQLNLYAFSRITQGKDKNGYHHDRFLRGMHKLSEGMTRIKVKGTRVRKAPRPEIEPDFYSYPPLCVDDLTTKELKKDRLGVQKKRGTKSTSNGKAKSRRSTGTGISLKSAFKIRAPSNSDIRSKQANIVTPPVTPRSDCIAIPSMSLSSPMLPSSSRDVLVSMLEEAFQVSYSCLEESVAKGPKEEEAYYAEKTVDTSSEPQPWPTLEWPRDEDIGIVMPPPPNDLQLKVAAGVTSSCSSISSSSPVKRQDSVLFFEGKPFHYLESDAIFSSYRALSA